MIFWIFSSKGCAEESELLHSNYTTTLIKGLSSVLIEIANMDLPLCDPHKGLWVRVPVCHHQLLCVEQWDRRGKASHVPGYMNLMWDMLPKYAFLSVEWLHEK